MILLPKHYNRFSVANNIERLTEPIFVKDARYGEYIDAKQNINHDPSPLLSLHMRQTPIQTLSCLELIHREAGVETSSLGHASSHLQEDIAIIRVEGDDDWLAYCHVSFPSGWRPEEAIGKSFAEIHKDIPGFVSSPPLVRALLTGHYQRFVWSPVYENKLNQYPGESRKFDIDNPQFWIKIEKQITIGLPIEGCFLFVMRQYIYSSEEVDIKVFKNTIGLMSPIHKEYKGITHEFESFLEKLK